MDKGAYGTIEKREIIRREIRHYNSRHRDHGCHQRDPAAMADRKINRRSYFRSCSSDLYFNLEAIVDEYKIAFRVKDSM